MSVHYSTYNTKLLHRFKCFCTISLLFSTYMSKTVFSNIRTSYVAPTIDKAQNMPFVVSLNDHGCYNCCKNDT